MPPLVHLGTVSASASDLLPDNTTPATRRRSPRTSRLEIARYWNMHRPCLCIDYAEPGCFACGYFSPSWDVGDWDEATPSAEVEKIIGKRWARARLDRAHLVPDSLGGTDEPANLVLLCSSCHRAAPNVDDPAVMLKWIEDRESWEARLWRKAEQTVAECKRLGMTDEDFDAFDRGRWDEVSAYVRKHTSTHFGDGTNPATYAAAIVAVTRAA